MRQITAKTIRFAFDDRNVFIMQMSLSHELPTLPENGVIGNYEELVTRSLCPCQLVINRNALTSNLPQGLLG